MQSLPLAPPYAAVLHRPSFPQPGCLRHGCRNLPARLGQASAARSPPSGRISRNQRTGRIEFAWAGHSLPALRTVLSPRIACHLASRQRDYLQLRAGKRCPAWTSSLLIGCTHRRTCRLGPSSRGEFLRGTGIPACGDLWWRMADMLSGIVTPGTGAILSVKYDRRSLTADR